MKRNSESAFCTSREAAQRLHVSLRTVQLWVDSGILEAWKTDGGHRRISIDSVERMLRKEAQETDMPAFSEPRESISFRLKILVVEDDGILLKLYKRHIESWSMPIDVFTATNGLEALLLIGRESPDLLITDLGMPDMDGFQMIRALTATPLKEGIEIAVVTGLDAYEISAKGGLPPSVKVYHKPVPFTELKKLVAEMLEKQRALEM